MLMAATLPLAAAGKRDTGKTASSAQDTVIPEETVTLQVFSQLANYSGLQAGWFADVLLEKLMLSSTLSVSRQIPESCRPAWKQEASATL